MPSHKPQSRRKNSISARRRIIPAFFMVPLQQGQRSGSSPQVLRMRSRQRRRSARALSANYGYGEIATPIFEQTEVFKRTLGDTSDVVTKEMYTFEDKGGDSITLRPEGTAAVARAFIAGKMNDQLPLKFLRLVVPGTGSEPPVWRSTIWPYQLPLRLLLLNVLLTMLASPNERSPPATSTAATLPLTVLRVMLIVLPKKP